MSELPIDPSIEAEAKKFAEQQEKTRTYQRPEDDPIYFQFQDEITKATNLDAESARQGRSGVDAQREANSNYGNYWTRQNVRISLQKWSEFARQYPEKALVYQNKNSWIEKALGPRQELSQEPQVETAEESKDSTEQIAEPQINDEDTADNLIPDKYKGMPSEMVEQMWTDAQYGGEQTNQRLLTRKEKAIDAIRTQEEAREQEKTKSMEDRYSSLTFDQQKEFASAQRDAVDIIDQAIRGKKEIADLPTEDQWVINKLKDAYNRQREQDPDAEPTLQFSQQIDRKVYTTLVNRLAFMQLEEQNHISDQTAANEIGKDINIPEQLLDTSQSRLSETGKTESLKLTQEEIDEIKNEAGYKYKESEAFDSQDGVNVDLMNPAYEVDWQTGEQFDAHGLAKDSISAQFDQLVNLLNNGIDISRDFHTAPLAISPDKAGMGAGIGTGGGTAYKDGSFIILGAPGKQISESGIKTVLVNDLYYSAIDRLSRTYPDVNFIRADQAKEALKQVVNSKSKG